MNKKALTDETAPKKRAANAKPKSKAKSPGKRQSKAADTDVCSTCGTPVATAAVALVPAAAARGAPNPDKEMHVAMLASRTTSKSVAVNGAVHDQLVSDGRWPPVDVTKAMGAIPYRYADASMRNFLDGVADKLSKSDPSYALTWDAAFVASALGWAVSKLMAEIEMKSV